jgi:lipopolysaccharide transport system permease protein
VIPSREGDTSAVELSPREKVTHEPGTTEPVRGDTTPVIVIDGAAHWTRWIADLSHYRAALYSLAWRNVRSRYKQAGLGMLWAVVQPAVQVGVFTLLFGMIARVPTGHVPYAVFALCGLIPWNAFAKILSDGAVALSSNQGLITKIFFPRIYLVLAAGASAIIDALVGLLLLAVAMIVFDVTPSARLWIAVPALAGSIVLSFGVAAMLAAINARWRDVQHTVPFIVQIGLFITPVLYQDSLLPERWRWIVAINPVSAFIEVFRSSVLGLPLPGAPILLTSFGVALVAAVSGAWYFTRVESTVVDVV